MKYISLCSGGMDSVTLLHQYREHIIGVISFNYGSKHNATEIEFAKKNAAKFGIPHIVIDMPFVDKYFKSDLLLSGGAVPDGHYEDITMKRTVVPFRNGIMLSIACGIAESLEADAILLANHRGDHAIYPDCRKDFIEAMNAATKAGTYRNIQVIAPYTLFSKRDIALIGKDYGVDFSLTYSCYKGKEIHCGVCGTCVERKEALEGFDPTIYQS